MRSLVFAVAGLICAAPATSRNSAEEAAPRAATTAPDLGARAFLSCRSCHNLKPSQPDTIGPNLAGFLGTRMGTNRPAYNYSDAAKASTVVWTDATLDRFLERPSAVVPGSRMAFAGISSPEMRAALIAYLGRETR